MNPNKGSASVLEDVQVNVKFKLSALWVAAMFCYAYADIKAFYKPGSIGEVMAGKAAGMQISQVFLLSSALLMAIPSVMVFLSLALKAKANRWANIIVGIFETVIILIMLFMPGVWAYLMFYGVVEIVLTSLIVWYACKWPRQERVEATP
jgi:uncharacterized membrane protein HdeD (DUF308 family)